jgi:hypothetical protein
MEQVILVISLLFTELVYSLTQRTEPATDFTAVFVTLKFPALEKNKE